MRLCLTACILAAFASTAALAQPSDPRLKNSYTSKKDGWTYIHLEGTPAQIGFQHGYLLATQMADNLQTIELANTHEAGKPWPYFRAIAHDQIMPNIEPEYLAELQGINHILMDGSPGLIHSGDDFGLNSAGIMITEPPSPCSRVGIPPASPSSSEPAKPCGTPTTSTNS